MALQASLQSSIPNRAASLGFTKEVFVELDNGQTLEGFVRENADYEGTFMLLESDTGDMLRVFGLVATVEEA